jgi:hypothetical protein
LKDSIAMVLYEIIHFYFVLENIFEKKLKIIIF